MESKKIKDYLHLYLGCDCVIVDDDGEEIKIRLNAYQLNCYRDWITSLRPILRPLSDMTNDEAIIFYNHLFPTMGNAITDMQKVSIIYKEITPTEGIYYEGKTGFYQFVDYFPWLLRRSFDLFGLIDAGLAIKK